MSNYFELTNAIQRAAAEADVQSFKSGYQTLFLLNSQKKSAPEPKQSQKATIIAYETMNSRPNDPKHAETHKATEDNVIEIDRYLTAKAKDSLNLDVQKTA